MKTDLPTSIGIAIIGVLIAYFVCDLLIGPIEPISFKTIDADINADLTEPNVNVFNYKALNPTVEVYVGEGCVNRDGNGECE